MSSLEELPRILKTDVWWDTNTISITNYPNFFYQSLGEKNHVLYLLYGHPTESTYLASSDLTTIKKSPKTKKVHVIKVDKAEGSVLLNEDQLKTLDKITEHLWRINYPLYLYEIEGKYHLYQIDSPIEFLVSSQTYDYGYIKGKYLYEEHCDRGGVSSRLYTENPIMTPARDQLSNLHFTQISDTFYQRGLRLVYLDNLDKIHFFHPVYLPFVVEVSSITKKDIIWKIKDYQIKIHLDHPLNLEIL